MTGSFGVCYLFKQVTVGPSAIKLPNLKIISIRNSLTREVKILVVILKNMSESLLGPAGPEPSSRSVPSGPKIDRLVQH